LQNNNLWVHIDTKNKIMIANSGYAVGVGIQVFSKLV